MDGNKRITISFGGVPMIVTLILLVLKLLNIGTYGWFWVFFPIILPIGLIIGFILLYIIIAIIGVLLERRW